MDASGTPSSEAVTLHTPSTKAAVVANAVVTDVTICITSLTNISSTGSVSTCEPDQRRIWHRIEKDLFLYSSQQQSAWLYVQLTSEEGLVSEDLLVIDIRVGGPVPSTNSDQSWQSRPGGIWVLRSKFSGEIDQVVTEVDVLFGVDAVDPRPQWTMIPSSLQIDAEPQVEVAKLSLLRGRARPRLPLPALRTRQDGKFKIVQISDTHMVTGVGLCTDALDADGKHLPKSEADPLTVNFIGKILDVEKPDLVILTGDQLHHDITDSQTALFKVVAPMIERSIPFAAVFGNHDSEGSHALSRQ
jgi:hypothetical protein